MKLAPAHTPNAGNFCDWRVKLSIYLPRWRVSTRSDTVVTANFHRGRERRVTAASRSPLLIAAALVNESISTGPLRSVSAASQERHAAAAMLSLRSVLFLTRAAAEPRQFKQSRPTGQEVK